MAANGIPRCCVGSGPEKNKLQKIKNGTAFCRLYPGRFLPVNPSGLHGIEENLKYLPWSGQTRVQDKSF